MSFPNRTQKSESAQNVVTYGQPLAWTIMSVANDPNSRRKTGVRSARMSMEITSPARTADRTTAWRSTKRTHHDQLADSDRLRWHPAMGLPTA